MYNLYLNYIIKIIQAYTEWQEKPIVATLVTTGKPISDIEFPAITICGQGTNDEVCENMKKLFSKCQYVILCLKVFRNVYEYQLSEHAKKHPGKAFLSLTDEELKALKSSMIKDNYPGKRNLPDSNLPRLFHHYPQPQRSGE